MMPRPGRILWSWQLLRLLMRALRPTPRGILQGRRSLRPTICEGAKPPLHSPMRGRSAPPPRVTFSPMRKSPKNLQGLRPLEPAGAKSPPFSRLLRSAPARAGLVSATDAAGFATLRWCGQLATPSPLALTKRNILLLIRGSAGFWLHFCLQLGGRCGVLLMGNASDEEDGDKMGTRGWGRRVFWWL